MKFLLKCQPNKKFIWPEIFIIFAGKLNRLNKNNGTRKITVKNPEDLILAKLLWYKESNSTRHLEDIESILKISGSKINFNYLNGWAAIQGTSKFFEKAKNTKFIK